MYPILGFRRVINIQKVFPGFKFTSKVIKLLNMKCSLCSRICQNSYIDAIYLFLLCKIFVFQQSTGLCYNNKLYTKYGCEWFSSDWEMLWLSINSNRIQNCLKMSLWSSVLHWTFPQVKLQQIFKENWKGPTSRETDKALN